MAIILVADDEDSIRRLLAMVLTTAGHEVLSARNGLEEVALFQSYQDRIDLVVTDLRMPVMDGHEAISRILERRPNTRIICITGYTDRDIPPGVTKLDKPFLPTDLISKVEEALEQR